MEEEAEEGAEEEAEEEEEAVVAAELDELTEGAEVNDEWDPNDEALETGAVFDNTKFVVSTSIAFPAVVIVPDPTGSLEAAEVGDKFGEFEACNRASGGFEVELFDLDEEGDE